MTTILDSRNIIMLIFTYLHTDLIRTFEPRFETNDVDFYFTHQIQTHIHKNFLRKYVLYKLPVKYNTNIEIPNPMISGNDYLPGTMYFRSNMFSDLIPMCLGLLSASTLKRMGTYRKILLRRYMHLQDSSFNYWNTFLQILKQPLILDRSSYRATNRIEEYFIDSFLEGLRGSCKLGFYLNYTGNRIHQLL